MQYNLVPAKGRWRSAAGKVTMGPASHWPCVTDSVVYPPTGSAANVWEMSTSPKPHWGTAACTFNQLQSLPLASGDDKPHLLWICKLSCTKYWRLSVCCRHHVTMKKAAAADGKAKPPGLYCEFASFLQLSRVSIQHNERKKVHNKCKKVCNKRSWRNGQNTHG